MTVTVIGEPVTSVPSVVVPSGLSPKAATGWLAGSAALLFAVSLIGTDLLGLQHDLYLLIYFTFALGYLAWFASKAGATWRHVLRANWWWSIAFGVLVGAAVIRQVMGQTGTGHPTSGYFVFELIWRGVVYGMVDALVLAVLPAVVAHVVLRGNRRGVVRKVAFGSLVLLFSLIVSAAYHAGYSTYRGDAMAKPLTGTVMWDVPAILTGNPAGAVVAHAAVHTTAVVHQYYGGDNHLLPPEQTASYPQNAGGTTGRALAAGWLVVVGSVLAGIVAAPHRRRSRPLLGLREQPGRFALAFMRMPLRVYRHNQGRLLGHTFLEFTHLGRNSNMPHQAVAMVLNVDGATGEAVICSAWGAATDWYRNLRVQPATKVTIGRDSFTPRQRFLTDEEAYDVAMRFRAAHPHRLRLMSRIMGWGDLDDDATVREFVRRHPFVGFRPLAAH